jgi:Domain of unknown function (DUF4865)
LFDLCSPAQHYLIQEVSVIAMQYSFVLPADYDMEIVRRRVAEKGHLLDRTPGLQFKAYLISEKDSRHASENSYAPFYVWKHPDSMTDFICGSGFVGLTQSFGWPSVMSWLVWDATYEERLACARFAVKNTIHVPPYAPLADLKGRHTADTRQDVQKRGALGSVAAFDPGKWTVVRFSLWTDVPADFASESAQVYEVRHVSAPAFVG